MARDVYADIGMPSTPFLRLDRFAALVDGKIYIGVKDTDPLNPANQTQVFVEDEDGTLTPVPQPIRTNVSGYPVWNGQVVKLITKIESSMKVLDRNDVQQFYFGNLFKYDPVQMWNLLTSPTGWEYVGTTYGTIKESVQGWLTPFQFVGKAPFTSVAAAIQTMFDTAEAQKLAVNAFGWEGTLDGNVTAENILIMGGTWKGTADFFLDNAVLKGATINNLRVRYWGGDVRIRDCLFDGKPTASKVGSIVLQANPKTGTIEVTECEFKNGLYGILQQGTGEPVTRGVYRNLSFYKMDGDGIELNVVQKHYDEGCLIDGIQLDTIGSANPSWGIGIGIAGGGPYGWDIPDSQYAKNVTITNVTAVRCRQCIHLEVARDCTVTNVDVNPDMGYGVGSGLTVGGVVCYGSKRITIDGVSGEPVATGTTDVHSLRMVMLEWGVTAGAPANPCFDMTVRNVHTKQGRVYAGVAAGNGFENRMVFENIDCYTLSLFGVASLLEMSNISCRSFDAVGDDSSGGTTSDGFVTRGLSRLRMINVNAIDVNGYGDQAWSKCSYSDIESIGSNVIATPYPPQGIAGGIGAIMTNSNRTYINKGSSGAWDGNAFPTGKEFMAGDLIVREDGKIFTVTASGAYIPATDNFKIAATAVGDKKLICNVTPIANETSRPWLFGNPLSPGTRILIPGAGDGGATLSTRITRGPYQTPPSNSTAPVTIDIADAIVTATPAGTQLAAAKPIQFRTPV